MIYLHIPFCRQACVYCDFHFNTSTRFVPNVVKAMTQELEIRSGEIPSDIESIYFGGGTPSLIGSKNVGELLSSIHKNFSVQPDAEITLEANPEDLTNEFIQDIQQLGVNRLSIGIQSFNNRVLKYMNRCHDAHTGVKAVEQAFKLGIENISIDLIYGIPISSNAEWKRHLIEAANLPVNHLSCYALTVEEKTPLAKNIKLKKSPEPKEESAVQQFMILQHLSGELGFEHYEISNLCKNQARARHNSNYWEGKPYLGIGPSAHSFDGKTRRVNIAHNRKYFEGIQHGNPEITIEELNEKTRYHELILTGIRTKIGIDLQAIQHVNKAIVEHFFNTLRKHENKFTVSEERISLKTDYWIIAERIALDFFL